jgi:hypothetical protein
VLANAQESRTGGYDLPAVNSEGATGRDILSVIHMFVSRCLSLQKSGRPEEAKKAFREAAPAGRVSTDAGPDR